MKPEDFLTPSGKLKRFTKTKHPEQEICRMYAETTVPMKEKFLAACQIFNYDRDTVMNLLMERFVEDTVDYLAGVDGSQHDWDEAKRHLQSTA